ncbi:alpha-mannosidase [Paenibacillus sp. sptzw28]|uniref:alpha-mannosidase n=1 Tax=Paenibacillus sp. sptzw28 TaxID=715179 RepID=UPI001C6F2A69|nr:alpha-mannosidase [Paenibacillus sp. sptzw28]QYR22349.1 alpha-mannosidase [Paenibacillus sp. sptzw28]
MPYEAIQPERLEQFKRQIEAHIYTKAAPLSVDAFVTREPVPYTERESGTHLGSIQPGDKWGGLWDCAWFHFKGNVPSEAAGKKVVLLIDVNGELCLVDLEGVPVQGLTNINSEFDLSLGLPGKRVVPVTDFADGDEIIDLWGDAGCNDLFGRYQSGTLREAEIAVCCETMRQLYFDVEVLLELALHLDPSSRRSQILQALYDVSLTMNVFDEEHAASARERLAPELQKRGGDPTLTVSAIGHAHIDLAWLWPIRETIRKGARTFSTVLHMMERYPDYRFGASQPQLYQWMKEHYPRLYDRIKARISEGRWEIQGAMWVEPDSNVSGGEALIRQVLYGQQFYEQEFGKRVRMLWVPDIFGYTAALPQILRKLGIDYMVTQKLSWNNTNDYPHHTFLWEGIDGSKVLTHLPPEDTYNSPAAPRSLVKIEKEYLDKAVSDCALMLFGIGDGGGGPGEEHLERLGRERNLLGLPPVVQELSIDFLDRLNIRADRYKTWRGELYLEKHQGTLTTQAKNKKYNRRMEKALRELEFAAVLAESRCNIAYPQRELDEIWKEVLLYQFHDILPGSSIKRVYDESIARYEVLLERTEQLIRERYAALAARACFPESGEAAIVFNSLPWERNEWLLIAGEWKQVSVPAMGYSVMNCNAGSTATVVSGLSAEPGRLENEWLRIEFLTDGTIGSLYDNAAGRELIPPGSAANRLIIYDDKDGDAWDFPADYRSRLSEQALLRDTRAYVDGPEAIVEQTYLFGQSRLVQRIVLAAGSRRAEFRTQVEWRESDKMLRAAFPLDIATDQVNCDIQFGYLKRPTHRNTSWDYARDEICAHHWIDLSESQYGAALLSDSKYGFRASGNELDINLLRSPAYPDPEADRGTHEFAYALMPHTGDFVQAQVYKAGYEFNVPLRPYFAGKSGTNQNVDYRRTFFSIDHPGVMIEAVKKSEDGSGLIIRLYEAFGGRTKAGLHVGLPFSRIESVNMMEDQAEAIAAEPGEPVALTFSAFEIKTLKVMF